MAKERRSGEVSRFVPSRDILPTARGISFRASKSSFFTFIVSRPLFFSFSKIFGDFPVPPFILQVVISSYLSHFYFLFSSSFGSLPLLE